MSSLNNRVSKHSFCRFLIIFKLACIFFFLKERGNGAVQGDKDWERSFPG